MASNLKVFTHYAHVLISMFLEIRYILYWSTIMWCIIIRCSHHRSRLLDHPGCLSEDWLLWASAQCCISTRICKFPGQEPHRLGSGLVAFAYPTGKFEINMLSHIDLYSSMTWYRILYISKYIIYILYILRYYNNIFIYIILSLSCMLYTTWLIQ